MKYPHWFCYVKYGSFDLPFAVMLVSEQQAICSVELYVKMKEMDAQIPPLVMYESLDDLLRSTGLSKSDLIILSDDDRGKSIAFKYCDEPGGRCNIDYYTGGSFY